MRVLRVGIWAMVSAVALLLGPGVAWGAGPSLTATPKQGPVGASVTLVYDTGYPQNQCSQGMSVHFTFDQAAIGDVPVSPTQCTATLSYRVRTGAACGPNHVYGAEFSTNQTVQDTRSTPFTVTCPSPTPTPTKSSPTKSATPRATATAPPHTAAPTATSTPKPSPTSTRLPQVRPTGDVPSFGPPPPPSSHSGGSSDVPWLVGGGLLAIAGIAVAVGVLAPRGAGKPTVIAVAIGALLGGGALAAVPTLNPPVTPAFRTAYVTSDDCSAGDIPLFGGYHAFDTRPTLYHFHPEATSWNAALEGVTNEAGDHLPGGPSFTVCLRVGRAVPHAVREKTVSGSSPAGSVSCQVDESLLGGGFYYPWGLAGMVGTHPEAPARWASADGPQPADQSAISGHVYALCAELPDGVRTYTTSASAGKGGTATARCFPGDAVLGGGWSGRNVRGTFPIDGGWTVELGEAGSAYALCYKPSRDFGLRASYVRSASGSGDVDVRANCDASDVVLGAGWVGGHGLDSLRRFEPVDGGWSINLVPEDGTAATAFVLCARSYSKS